MALSDQRAKREGSYTNRAGVEFVTLQVAADRLHKSRTAIVQKINDKKLKVHKFKNMGNIMLVEWEKCKAVFIGSDPLEKNKPQKKPVELTKASDFELKDLNSGELTPVEQKEMPSLVDVDDPENSDCWKLNSLNQPVVKNGHHIILYDKFKQKYDALIRKQQFEREKGQLISKDLVDTAFSKMLTPLVNTINQIPDRYASRIIGFVESIMETKLDNSQTTSLRALLEDEAVSIIGQLKKNEEDAIDGLLV